MSEPGATELPCGLVGLMGRPNVGKSTLLNALLGEKVSIVTRRPQTTRHRIVGIRNRDDAQIVYVDTPGLHRRGASALNRMLNDTAASALSDVDVTVLVMDAQRRTAEDDAVLERLQRVAGTVILAINKVDRIKGKESLLPVIDRLSREYDYAAVVPVSAHRGTNLAALEHEIVTRLPSSPALFARDQVTDRSERFLAAELVREQLMGALGDELPYASTVEIEAFESEGGLRRIAAIIWVERPGQKRITIGEGGDRLKQMGRSARLSMEQRFDARVYLKLWVKVRSGWSNDEQALRSLGYTEG